jgi:hypothetical protein
MKTADNQLIITEGERQEMLEAALPLMRWMGENLHPHTKAIVNSGHIELMEGLATASPDDAPETQKAPPSP